MFLLMFNVCMTHDTSHDSLFYHKLWVFVIVYYMFGRLRGYHGRSVVMAANVIFMTRVCRNLELF